MDTKAITDMDMDIEILTSTRINLNITQFLDFQKDLLKLRSKKLSKKSLLISTLIVLLLESKRNIRRNTKLLQTHMMFCRTKKKKLPTIEQGILASRSLTSKKILKISRKQTGRIGKVETHS